MAKTGIWLQGARGKLAGVALQKSAWGGTVARQITKPTDRKTEAQLISRVITNTVMQAYSNLKGICDHSFEGVAYGAQSMRYFLKINNAIMRNRVAEAASTQDIYNFNVKGDKSLMPNPYIISSGTLPLIPVSIINADNTTIAQILQISAPSPTNNVFYDLGYQEGDQITFITINGNDSYGRGITVNIGRHILARKGNDMYENVGTEQSPAWKLQGTNFYSYEDTPTQITFGTHDVVEDSTQCFACAVIGSRKDNNGNWLRSSSTMYVGDAARELSTLEEAVNSMKMGVEIVASPYYLNNAQN